MHDLNVPDRPRPGWPPGALIGVAAGLLLSAIWGWGAADVALAVSLVFAGLVASLVAASAAWRPFATALLVAAAAVAAAVVLLFG